MDFTYTEEQTSILELAGQILRDGTSQERLREIEAADGPRFDRELWSQLADAGLLAVAIPEAYDGAGLGFLEVGAIVETIGRTAAPVPFLEYVAVADFEGYVHLISRYDGQVAGRIEVDGKGVSAAPVVADDVLYVYGNSGKLAAYIIE